MTTATTTTTTTMIATTVAAAVMVVVAAVVVAAMTVMPKATMGWLRRMDRIATLTTTCVMLTAIY